MVKVNKNLLNLVDLDFDSNKESLIDYLKSQDQFKDYDYTGSNLNVLLDILSYNTVKNAFYLNMVASESFLDSAQLRESVVSHAKQLNYCPRSARSSKITIKYNFTDANTKIITIPKGTTFTTTVGFDLMTFVTADDKTIGSPNGYFDFTVDLYEGQYVTDTFVVDDTIKDQRYILTNDTIDTDSLSVKVYENDGNKILKYKESESLLDIDSSSKVYFLQASDRNQYEIIFGNDVLGRKPAHQATIVAEYRITRGSDGNGANNFTLAEDITGITSKTISIPEQGDYDVSYGGDEPETIESIKFNAPRHYQLQERAISANDYEILLQQKFPEISSIAVYGGEELSPPKYGKVYVAVDITDVDGLPSSKRTEYYNYVKSRSPLSIDPVIIEPDMMYYQVNSIINYNVNLTDKSKEDIRSEVITQIKNYNTAHLNKFRGKLRYSKLITEIDETDDSIVSNETDILIYKKFEPELGTPQNIVVTFKTPLDNSIAELSKKHKSTDKHTISSSQFVYKGERAKFADNGDGKITIVKTVNEQHVVIDIVGRVNYDIGKININNVTFDDVIGGELKIYAVTKSKDVSSNQNTIFTLEDDELNVTVQEIRE